MAIHVNTTSISASSTAASAYSATIPAGTGIIAGDLIVVVAVCDGTHANQGMTVQDSVNLVNFSNLTPDVQLGGSSASWQQTFYYVAAANIPDASLITLTPYASATHNAFTVDIFRYALGTVVNTMTHNSNAASTSQAAPALGAAPVLGSLVLTFDSATAGNLTPGSPFTAGSAVNGTGASCGLGFATANGSGTFASTWTDSSSAVSATQTVAFKNAGVGIPYVVGSTAQAAGSSSTVVNVTTTTVSGDAFFCCIGTGAGSTVTPAATNPVVDSKGHTWTLIGSFVAANSMACYVYQSLHATTTLVAGTDTVTVSWSGTTYAKFVEVIGCAGINQTAALDQSATASGVTAAPAASTHNLANNNELILALITSGALSQGITWASNMTPMDAGLNVPGGVYFSVATQVVLSNTSPVTAGATLGAAAVWADLALALLPDPPTGSAATVTVTTGSPLPAGQVTVAYSDQLTASGGLAPYTWARTSGTIPPGLQLTPGNPGGSGNFTFVGANTGPQGGPSLANWNTAAYGNSAGTGTFGAGKLGPLGCYKVFFSGSGNTFPTVGWPSTLAGQITAEQPGVFVLICWNGLATQTQINAFVRSIPTNVIGVGFGWNSEPEHVSSSGLNAGSFQSGWADQMQKVYNAKGLTTVPLYTITTGYMAYYQGTDTPNYATVGSQGGSNWIPPTTFTDVYGIDFYDRHQFWAGADMSSDTAWGIWTGYVRHLNRPLAIPEFGISAVHNPITDAQESARLQADLQYLQGAFGQGGSLSQSPLFMWLYWNTGGAGVYGGSNINQFVGAQSEATWKGIVQSASNQPSTGTGNGGLLFGTPTTTSGSPFTFSVTATDSSSPPNVSAAKPLTITINAANSLSVSTTGAMAGGTQGVPYSAQLQAAGGNMPYSWALTTGSLPTGTSITDAINGVISGTPSVANTFSFTVTVTDSTNPTPQTAVSGTLTIAIAPSVDITTTTLPAATQGVPYSATISATGGTSPYSWSLDTSSVALPTGLTLDPVAGTISGTPTQSGQFNLTVDVADSSPTAGTDSQLLTLTVALPSGGLPPVGRRSFGGGEADWTFAYSGNNLVRAAGVAVTFWNTLVASSGTQYTDLTTNDGNPITQVVTDANGRIPQFFGPAGVWIMAADANGGAGPRQWILAADMGSEIQILYNFLGTVVGFG